MARESHQHIVTRLKRASGHLTKIIAMIEEEARGLDVAQQLQAATVAPVGAKRV